MIWKAQPSTIQGKTHVNQRSVQAKGVVARAVDCVWTSDSKFALHNRAKIYFYVHRVNQSGTSYDDEEEDPDEECQDYGYDDDAEGGYYDGNAF